MRPILNDDLIKLSKYYRILRQWSYLKRRETTPLRPKPYQLKYNSKRGREYENLGLHSSCMRDVPRFNSVLTNIIEA